MTVIFGLVAVLVMIPLLAYATLHLPTGRFQWLLGLLLISLIALIIPVSRQMRAARVERFEMCPDAIASYTVEGWTVLPYADITGDTSILGKGYYEIGLLTRRGTGVTIRPTYADGRRGCRGMAAHHSPTRKRRHALGNNHDVFEAVMLVAGAIAMYIFRKKAADKKTALTAQR